MSRPRIVVLGGGVGGVTAAVALSRGDWRRHYESITLYQQGWRLGGKGASGRRRGDLRIEEHGLHIWFGFYENAFRMLRECHQELDHLADSHQPPTPRWKLAFTTMEDSFRPCGPITLADHDGCRWTPWGADFFRFDDDRPWSQTDPRPPGQRPEDWSAVYFAARCLFLAADVVASLLGSGTGQHATIVPGTGQPPRSPATEGTLRALLGDTRALLSVGLRELLTVAAGVLDSAARLGATIAAESVLVDLVLRAVDFATAQLRNRADRFLRADDRVRRAWYVVDLMLAITRGMLADGILTGNDFRLINNVDFRDWLRGHGADRETADSALVRAVVYDLAFAYLGGDPQQQAAEAGTALRGLLRTFFTYRGALMWTMNASMGDVVFAPLYELLTKRGVTVEFFHRVERVGAADREVREVELHLQATTAPGTTAANFLATRPGGLSPDATALWPSRPLVDHTTGGPQPVATTYESWLSDPGLTKVEPPKVLRHGVDFTDVVFALPISMVPEVAGDLLDQSCDWRAAVEAIKTVPTQAVQLWLNQPASRFSDHADGAIVGGFTEPYDTWADMNHLCDQEQVGARTVAYFCNVLADSPLPERGSPGVATWLKEQDELVRAQALRFLKQDVRHLWSHAVHPLTGELDWGLLVAPDGTVGEARLDAQFLRANVEPSERYVLSVPGSSAHRIHPAGTGFRNLVAAGDWTACGLDAGCVEAAVISGLLAANGIAHRAGATEQIRHIIGYDGP